MLIKLNGISKVYRTAENDLYALDDINLTIAKGEFLAVLGSSGSGKSTLMNILGCLDKPTKGEYILDGERVETLNDRQLSKIRNRKIGFIFQGFNLIKNLTAYENVELPLMYAGVGRSLRKELCVQALEQVGLQDRLAHKPTQMSGGQQQRVAIARAIATSPQIVLADEPTGNLDTNSAEDVMNILFQLNKEGKTIVMITHDKNIAQSIPKQISILNGKIV